MTPIHSISRSRSSVALVTVWLFAVALLLSVQAEANPRYASMVVDADSGAVLSADHADAPRYPASLTKMMTLYLLFEALESGTLTLEDTLPVSAHAAAQPPSKLWVSPGDRLTVEKAIQALVVRSANDVAVVVAEALGGSERNFAMQMTARARALGMAATTFRNASGLPDDAQITTARDMITLSRHLMQDFPQYYPYFSLTKFTYRGKTHTGHNRLLDNYPGADGLKTGYIRASGFNVATSAMHDGRRIVSVVMGGITAKSRDAHMVELLDRGFARASLLSRGDWIANADVFGTRAAERSMALAAASADAETMPATAQGDAFEDPIRSLLARVDTSATPSRDGWAVQVGAFQDHLGARNRADQAAGYLSELGNVRVAVMPSDGDRTLFRARLVDLQEAQARNSCQQLMQRGMDCVVVRAGL